MLPTTFRALVSLNSADGGGVEAELPAITNRILLRGHHPRLPDVCFFSALIRTDDEEPLRPGDSHHIVTLTTVDDRAREYLTCGTGFELWHGHEIGHGTITRRVFI